MTWTLQGNPRPRPDPQRYTPVLWPDRSSIDLSFPVSGFAESHRVEQPASKVSFAEVVAARRSRYAFGAPSHMTLGKLFGLTCRVQVELDNRFGFPLSRRPAPSAGGIHPIHVVVHLPDKERLHRYEPFTHTLVELGSDVDVADLRASMDAIVLGQDAALLLFIAEPGKTLAKYSDGDSLVWRDAGVLQGFFSLAAEALDLNFTPLGVTGEPWSSCLVEQGGLHGVGVALVGTRV